MIVNEKEHQLTEKDLHSLFKDLKINPEVVVVEKNGEIIPRKNNCELKDGDRLEIIKFVGGG
ncbi:MAG: sulfur carrier protein ThiS [Candidatus Margulisbacteria bacterium]|nr:sulfur carrier protein ThiS [Candidatus Margulisiibacteriota bacterium]MBU1022364.1 sulfur carrier protein ThiS [Candidatus Margulisiibacteriota bacterium]MBU1729084.1 sulfur carrier protein ThiS [Candidatus Margulisiibacteriota bacterium]MBU1954495.1 sulfur carrier protein ThiS [Candidatus Margulisiibacteriota bacterium]